VSEGTTRGEAAAHILAREMGRRTRALHMRIDDVEKARRETLEELRAKHVAIDGMDERQDGLIDGLRAEAERAEKDAKEALELAERTALATWIAGHPDLPEAARNALARATGVTLPVAE